MASERNTVLALLGLSFALRLCLWLGVEPVLAGDEYGYRMRGLGFAAILEALAAGQWPAEAAFDRAYGRGLWPPLHPFLLGLGMALPGDGEALARLVVACLSAITTPVVYALTRGLWPGAEGRPAAAFAAGLHVAYPSFVAWSQLLWSETTYVLVLLLAAALAVRLCGPSSVRRPAWLGALCGVCLGGCALARVSAAPYLLLVPAWLWLGARGRGRRTASGLALLVGLLAVAPWQAVLVAREGSAVPLSTGSGYNLLLHNGPFAGKDAVRREIRRVADERGVHRDRAARSLALAAIAERPGAFLARSALRLRRIWNVDGFVLRHLLRVLYPPPPAPAFYPVFALLLLSWLGLLALAAVGALAPGIPRSPAALLIAMVAVGAALPAISIGNSRMGIPLLALLLPFAGRGAARLWDAGPGRKGALAAGAIAGLALLNTATLDRPFGLPEVVSSHFRRELRVADAVLGGRTPAADCLGIRTRQPDVLTLELPGAGYRFSRNRSSQLTWTGGVRGSQKLDVYAEWPAGPLRLVLRSRALSREAVVEPVARSYWNTWRPSGLEGIEVWWCGFANVPPPP